MKQLRIAKVIAWMFLGPAPLLVAVVAGYSVPVFEAHRLAMQLLGWFIAVWGLFFGLFGANALIEAGWSKAMARWWLRAEGMAKADWTGGTFRGLVAGMLLGGVSVIDQEGWQQVFTEVWPDDEEAQ